MGSRHLDMSNMGYTFGNALVDALSPLWEINIFDDTFKVGYLLSDLNKDGFASLWGFDINQPPRNIFFCYEDALQYVEAEYEL